MKPRNIKTCDGMVWKIYLFFFNIYHFAAENTNQSKQCPQILLPPLESTDTQQEVFPQEEEIVKPGRAEAVPLDIHDEPCKKIVPRTLS